MRDCPGTAAPREVVLSFGSKRKNQRKLPLFRRSGPATKGLHAPWNPKAEVAECAGYANAVLLFALNARALCSDLKFGCSPEPPRFLTAAIISGDSPQKGSPFRGAGRASRPEGSRRALRHRPFPPRATTRPRHPVGAGHARPAALPLPPLYLLHRREGS